MQPKVSVIMPSLNVGPYIRECIDSVVNQSLKEIEIICVDAGSTDGTLEVLEEYAANDKRIVIIHSDKKSYGHQMNLGIEAANGEYIGIVETDDYIALNMYEELYAIAKEKQLEVLRADCIEFRLKKGKKSFSYIKLACSDHLYNTILNPAENLSVFKANHLSVTGIYLASFIKQNVRYHETSGASYQDVGFKLQCIANAKNYMFCNKAYYYYRQDNPNSSIHSKDKVYAAADEQDWAREKLIGHPNEKVFAPGYAYCRFASYEFTTRRIAPEFRLEFLQRYAEDFCLIAAAGELDRSLYTNAQWEKIHEIMECPEYIYYLDYYKEGHEKAENARQKRRADRLQSELDSVHNSISYRIGRGITWLPRKIRGSIQCYQCHGAGYTVRRTLYHIGLWEDEEAPKGPENRPKIVKHAERILHPKKGK